MLVANNRLVGDFVLRSPEQPTFVCLKHSGATISRRDGSGVKCKVLRCLRHKPKCLMEATRSKKPCHQTELNLLLRSDHDEYVEEHTIYSDRSKTERGVDSAFVV